MIGEVDLLGDAQHLHLGLHALELDTVIGIVQLDAVQHAEEIVVPPRAAEFAVGDRLQPDLLLLLDDLLDLAVFHLLQLRRGDLALFALGARFLHGRGAQDGADVVGAEWRLGTLGHRCPPELEWINRGLP
jgi:hypothetical protein